MELIDYVSDSKQVEAVVITTASLGELVQFLYENGAEHVIMRKMKLNPLQEYPTFVVSFSFYIDFYPEFGVVGDYVVRDVNTGRIQIISKEVFEDNYSYAED